MDERWGHGVTRTHCLWCRDGGARTDAECARCGARSCATCASGECRGCRVLDSMRSILRGEDGRIEHEHDAGKVAQILRTHGEAGRDVLLSPATIALRALGDPRRHHYFPDTAPTVLRDWLRATGITRLEVPMVARARPTVPWIRKVGATKDELVWLVPLERGVEARFRPLPSEGALDAPITIPEEGPWSLPAPWTSEAVWLTLDPPGRACAHCGARHERYRLTHDRAWVCSSCGRSFVPV
ncbi:hypothetical protein [Sandaracinus amylolyticus]|uniref:hypothetical protein n=1 Tax=Sandaracinus amylolyticus TaxID=927083 RepID=UPI001F19974F|nr:hypothetical protein [Sandaracinus amylolyticus]UJR86460.1 Hypothetical protein I5071_85550 [Sandaracinus amylolyticus]